MYSRMTMKSYKYKQQVSLGTDQTGKRIRKWIYANSKNELALIRARLQDRYKNGGIPVHATFREYADLWMETYKQNKSAATRNAYEHSLRKCDLINAIPVERITNTDLQRLINSVWSMPETARKLSITLHQIFSQLIRDGVIDRNPADGLELPKKPRKGKRVLQPEELARIRELLSSDVLDAQKRAFLAVLYYFGLRPEEARALTSTDFDFKMGELTVSRALSYANELGEIKGTKTDNIRVLPIPTAALDMLKEYCDGKEYLFTKVTDGELHTKTSYRRLWASIVKAIDPAPGFTPYVLRRNYATNLYYSGISLKKAAYLMGHSDTKMIMEVYAQIDDSKENLDAVRNFL